MFLENTRMEITVSKIVILGGKTFHPKDNLVAQATDSGLATWHIGYQPGGSVCTVNKDELEKRRTEDAIKYDWPI
jgi:hypothetical protein